MTSPEPHHLLMPGMQYALANGDVIEVAQTYKSSVSYYLWSKTHKAWNQKNGRLVLYSADPAVTSGDIR